MKSQLTLATLVLCATTSTGCLNWVDVVPSSLVGLNGLRKGETRVVEIQQAWPNQGALLTVSHETEWQFREVNGPMQEGGVRSFELKDGRLHGSRGGDRPDLNLNISRLDLVRAGTYSPGKTAGLFLGVTIPPIVLVITGALFLVDAAVKDFLKPRQL
jgi:hypothetical protein